MPLIACPECSNRCSDRAAQCPQCGYPLAATRPCSDCGHTNAIDAATCTQCGGPLTSARPHVIAAPNSVGDAVLGGVAPPLQESTSPQPQLVSAIGSPIQTHHQPIQPIRPIPVQPMGPLPGAPTFIPVEPRAAQIVFGLVILALAIWLIASWLPDHRPMTHSGAGGLHGALCAARTELRRPSHVQSEGFPVGICDRRFDRSRRIGTDHPGGHISRPARSDLPHVQAKGRRQENVPRNTVPVG